MSTREAATIDTAAAMAALVSRPANPAAVSIAADRTRRNRVGARHTASTATAPSRGSNAHPGFSAGTGADRRAIRASVPVDAASEAIERSARLHAKWKSVARRRKHISLVHESVHRGGRLKMTGTQIASHSRRIEIKRRSTMQQSTLGSNVTDAASNVSDKAHAGIDRLTQTAHHA